MSSAPEYVELYSTSNFTFLRGASFPEELVEAASSLGYGGLALTDECSLAGVVRAHLAARRIAPGSPSFRFIVGSEFVLNEAPTQGGHSLSVASCDPLDHRLTCVLLATSRLGYGQLAHLITCARRQAAKGTYHLNRAMLEAHLPDQCLALWIPPRNAPVEVWAAQAAWLGRLFNDRLWLAVQLLMRGDDRRHLRRCEESGARYQIPRVAVGGVLMHSPLRRMLQDTVTAIRLGRPLTALGYDSESNGERHLRDLAQLRKLYPPALLKETLKIAERCSFSLDELRYEYPQELVPPGYTPQAWLRELTEQGIRLRWPMGPTPKVRNLIEHELKLIHDLRYEHYFLTVHDIVAYARNQGILCQGRGSAANSVVCYCLGITEVDPDRVALLFERFISRERDEPPDIDVDFENGRREEVIQYIYAKYGRERAALAATVITYRARSAIRDVGKALNLSAELIDRIAKAIYWWGDSLDAQLADAKLDHADPEIQRLVWLTRDLIGFPRHLSQHVGGFVISQGLLSHLVPIENAAMAQRTVIQWEKDDLEALGLLKVDVLALGMLTAINQCLKLVSQSLGHELTIQKIPAEDPKVYDMMGVADTVGVFQIESRAQMSMLPRLRPRNYYDLVIQIAIVRPGPIQGDMVHPYLARRSGREPVIYPSEEVRGVLERTLGVPIFQEQVMQLAMVAAGFSGGEADQLRRAMAAWKKKGGLEPYRERLIEGMLARGYSRIFAEQLFRQIQGFGDYGFPESHSASFALLAYVSAWLKCHHPAAFCCALLNSQPMGFYAPAQLIADARRHGVVVLPATVNASDCQSTLEMVTEGKAFAAEGSLRGKPEATGPRLAVRIGFDQIHNLTQAGARAIVKARAAGPYVSIQDLVFRSGIDKSDLEALAAADALRQLSGDRHQAFWVAAGEARGGAVVQAMALQPSLTGLESWEPEHGPVLLPVVTEGGNIIADYAATGFTLRRHPLALLRDTLTKHQVTTASGIAGIAHDGQAKVVGIVTCRQRPLTASGVSFITLEDETGSVNVIVWPAIGERQRPVLRQAKLLGVSGRVQHSDGVTHLIATQLTDLSAWLGGLHLQSRDFT